MSFSSENPAWLAEVIRKDQQIDVSRDFAALQRVQEAAKKADEEFQSGAASVQINLPFITATASGPKHFNRSISLQEWNEAKGASVAPDSVARLAGAPREVPASLAIVNVLNWTTMIGWLIFACGSIYFWKSDAQFNVIFPIIGLSMIAVGLLNGHRRNNALRDGLLAMGRLTFSRPTDPNIEESDYELTFEFTSGDGRRGEAKMRTTDVYLIGRVSHGLVPLLCDPRDPSHARPLAAEPVRPTIDDHGELRGRPPAAVARLMLVVVILAAAIASYLYAIS
jgi:hypothetical protein